MGWMFTLDKRTRKELLEYLRRPERYGENLELLRSVAVGNNHWYLCRRKDDGPVWIGLDLMKGGGKSGHGWGWKDLDETCGPVEVNCPLSFLDQASPTDHEYAAPWREAVRAYHAKKKARPAPAPEQVVEYANRRFKLVRPAGRRRGWIVTADDGIVYRMTARQISQAQVVA